MALPADSKRLTDLIAKTLLYDPSQKKRMPMENIWLNNEKPLVVVHWLRIFGCPIARLVAKELTDSLIKLEKKFPGLFNFVGIGLSTTDYLDFVDGNYFKGGKIYIDETNFTHKILKFGKMGPLSTFGLLDPRTHIKLYEAGKKSIKGDLIITNAIQLGGTFIINKNGDVLYSHFQSYYGDEPSEEDLFEVFSSEFSTIQTVL